MSKGGTFMKRLLIAPLLTTWAACGDGASAPTSTITVGTVIDKSGSNYTASWVHATDLAFADMNAALRQTAHRNLQFTNVSADSQSLATVAVDKAKEVVRARGAKAIVTDISLSDVAINALNYAPDEADRLGVPISCFVCTSAAINNPSATNTADPVAEAGLRDSMQWNWRTAMLTSLQAPVLIQILLARGNQGDVNGDGVFKVSIYATREAFGETISNAIKAAAQRLHPSGAPKVEQIFLNPTSDPRNYDFASDLVKLTDKRNENTNADDGVPDIVFNTVFLNYSIALLKAYVEGDYTVPLMAGDTFRRRTALDVLGDAANGQEGTSPLVADTTPSGEIFKRELMEATNLTPSSYDPQAYDAVAVLLLAALIASQPLSDPAAVTPVQIRDAMRLVNDANGEVVRPGPDGLARAIDLIAAGQPINYEGASGTCDFDQNRTAIGKIVRWKVENRRFNDFEQYDCAKGTDCPLVQ
jgi:ABC-type branched-subunit amino acid transport system substrate-binding protein